MTFSSFRPQFSLWCPVRQCILTENALFRVVRKGEVLASPKPSFPDLEDINRCAGEAGSQTSACKSRARQGTNFSLAALGNSMELSKKRVWPAWMSPVERDSAFWRSGAEGYSLLLKVMSSTSLLMVAVAARFRNRSLLIVLSGWRLSGLNRDRQLQAKTALNR